MSRILRRPMFRGGPVSSYGTGIASGLADGGRGGFDNGGFLPAWAKNLDTRGYQIGSDLLNKQPTSLEELQNSHLRTKSLVNQFGNQDPTKVEEMTIEDKIESYTPDGDVNEKITEILEKESTYIDSDGVERSTITGKEIITPTDTTPQDGFLPTPGPQKGVEEVKKVEEVNPNDPNDPANQPERYEINADDVRAQAALFDELLNEGYEKDKKSAQIQDLSDIGLSLYEKTIGEGKGIKQASGEVAGDISRKPSRTEKVQEGKKKTKQTAAVMAINKAIAEGKSDREIEKMITSWNIKGEIDLKTKLKLSRILKSDLSQNIIDAGKAGSIGVQKLIDGIKNTTDLKGKSIEQFNSGKGEKVEYKKGDENKVFIDIQTEEIFTFDEEGKPKPLY